MNRRPLRLALAALACLLALSHGAGAETLDGLVAREEGVALGPCRLDPPPTMPGGSVHAVVPARFETPAVWATRSLLLVGVDTAGAVQGVVELTLPRPVFPRDVIGIRCSGDRLTIRVPTGTTSYRWDGRVLRLKSPPQRRP